MEREIPAVSIQPSQGAGNSCRVLGFLEENRDCRVMGCAFDAETFGPDLPFVDCMAVLCPKAESI